MRLSWKSLLIILVVCGTSSSPVMASESGPIKEKDVTKTNHLAKEKQEEYKGPAVNIQNPFIGLHDDNLDVTADEEVKNSDENDYHDVLRRWRRSASINMTENTHNTTASDSSAGNETVNVMKIRSAIGRLTKELQSLPTSHVIPVVFTDKGTFQVSLFLSVIIFSILNVNDVQQTLTSDLFMLFTWRDEALKWNESLYDGVNVVMMPPDSIWTPPVFVSNSKHMNELLKEDTFLIVTSEGYVHAYVAVMLETLCSLDLTLYPYDEQTCAIQITSFLISLQWHVHGSAVNDSFGSLMLNSEWDLTNVSIKMIDDGASTYPEVVIRLRRKTTFYSICLVLPMAVTSYMNILVFLLPLQSGEKISFLVTLFVSTSVYTSFFSNTMPRGLDEVPIAMKLLVGVIVESILVLLITLLILRRFRAEQEASAAFTCSTGSQCSLHVQYRNSAAFTCSTGTDSKNWHSDDNNPTKSPVISTREQPSQALQEQLQPGDNGMGQLSSRSPRVKPFEHADHASRATRVFGLRVPTSYQLDKLMFVIFLAANTIFYVTVLYSTV